MLLILQASFYLPFKWKSCQNLNIFFWSNSVTS